MKGVYGMKRMIRSECYRAFTSKGFFLSVAIGVIITLVYFFHYVLPVDLELLVSGYNGKTDPEYPGVLYNLWFGGRYPCAEKQLFFWFCRFWLRFPLRILIFKTCGADIFIMFACVRIKNIILRRNIWPCSFRAERPSRFLCLLISCCAVCFCPR